VYVIFAISTGRSKSADATASRPPDLRYSKLHFILESASYKFATYTNYAVYGMCSGNSTNSSQAPVPATFEGITGFSVISSETVTFTDCTPPSISATGTSYFDGNFVPVGSSINGGEYGVYLTPPVVPVSVQVGDTGTIGTKTAYSDNTKSNVVGHDDMTYVIEADTANTAMVDLITKSYDSNGVLLITTHNRFKILPAGYLIPYSVDIRSSALHLVLVANTSYNSQGIDSFSPMAVSSPSSVQVSVTFREPIDTASITNNTFSLVSSTGVVVAGAIQFSGRTATFIPSAPLADGTYTVTVSKDVKSIYGMPMVGDYSVPIIIDAVPPSVVSVSPADGSTAVPVYVPGYDFAFITPLSVTFSEPLWLTGAEFIVTDGGIPVAGRVAGGMTSGGAPTATFTPDVHWKPNTTYTARITTGISDSVGNHPASDYVWSFTTESFLFKEYVTFAAGSPGEAVAIGDVNNDGRSDVVMTTSFYFSPATDYKLFVFLQNASGGLDVTCPDSSGRSFLENGLSFSGLSAH
jgi:hypothetical protein